jgi:class 3 adenylate cyclase/predicted ATPase
VQCPGCKANLPVGSKFCGQCGAALASACPSCGHANPAQNKFCSECGTRLSPEIAPPPAPTAGSTIPTVSAAERRQLTIMFCDIVGSSALSTRLDPEEQGDVIAAFHTCCANEIKSLGGMVAQYLGDGVLAYFGYPTAHENDAERAILSGLAILKAVGTLKPGGDVALQTRIAIGSGVVVVGDLIRESLTQENAAIGETTNLVARLQGIAGPNTIVISPVTHRLVGALFDYRDLGRHTLRGFSEPVHVRQVLGVSKVESRFEAQHQSETSPLLGREEDLELLVRRWEEAKRGEGRVVLLTGEPGIGKSRIARALRDRLRSDPHTPLNYFCSPHHQGSALYPFIIQLTRAADIDRDDSADVKLDKLHSLMAQSSGNLSQDMPLFAALLSIGDDRYPLPEMNLQRSKERTLAALLDHIKGLAMDQPILMLYEDLHWIDPTSLELLSLAIEQIRDQRVLLLATARPEFTAPWPGHRHVSTLPLNRFGRSEGEALIVGITKGKPLPPEVRDQIMARTDGVPLFIEELTKTVLESGLLHEAEGHFELTGPLPSFAIPSTLHASLLARLDRLAAVKDVAQIGAVIGREFSYTLIAAAAALKETTLNAALAQLVDAELIYQRGVPPDATYQFKHALVQDASYASLVRSRRQQLHSAIARALEERFPDIVATEPETVAHHFTEAGLWEQATHYWQRAGDLALRRSAVGESVMHFSSGLRVLETMGHQPESARRELAIQLGLGTALNIAYGSSAPAVAEHYARAVTIGRQLGVDKQLFRAVWGSWYTNLTTGRTGQALVLAEELVDVAEQLADQNLILEARHSRWATSHVLGLVSATLADTKRGVELYHPDRHHAHAYEYGGHDTGVCAHAHRAVTLWIAGLPEQAARTSVAALELGRRLGHPPSLAHAASWSATLRQMLGEPRACRELAELTMRIAHEQGSRIFMMCPLLLGWTLFKTGRVSEGLQHMDEAISVKRQRVYRFYYDYELLVFVEALLEAGEPNRAQKVVEEALDFIKGSGNCLYEAEAMRLKAVCLTASDREMGGEAEVWLLRAIETAERQGALSFALRAAMSLAQIRRDLGRQSQAQDPLARIYGRFTEGLETPDLKDARVLLNSLHTARPAP